MAIKFDWDRTMRQGIISGEHFEEIRGHFSVKNEAARFARFRGGYAPPRKYVITQTGRFDAGLYKMVREYIDKNFDSQVVITDAFNKCAMSKYSEVKVSKLKLDLRDYQQQVVSNCLTEGRGTVILATAGGKTLTIASLLESIYKANKEFRCVLIVPDLGLVNQTYKDLDDYGVSFSVSKWTGKIELNLSSNVIICNLGILQSKKSDTEWLSGIDVCIIDEVHKLRKGNKVNKLFKLINTPHRFGFTGTMPEEVIDQWNIIGKIGPVIYERNSYQLRQDNYISDVKVQVLKVSYDDKPNYPRQLNDPAEKYRAELDFIIHNDFRNNLLSKLCNNFDKNCLILVDYIKHGSTLHKHLTDNCKDKKVYYIRGEIDVEDRDRVRGIMEMQDNVIVVAISKIFSTGINIKNLHYIIFGSGGKAKIKTIQSIGRGLRLHKNKSELIIFDIGDDLQYGLQHLAKRITHYNKEQIEYGIQEISQKN